MNKICTDLIQSKRLMELGIDRKSSDMYYWCRSDLRIGGYKAQDEELDIPAWSLTALLAQMPCSELVSSQDNKYRVFWKDRFSEWHTNAVDACVELLERVRKEKEK